jgi:hypothetical protein
MVTELKRLLIMACSQRKRSDPGLLPAVERYDGPAFQVLRKFRREHPIERSLDTYILSAKFGLIPASKPIPRYDSRMTPKWAQELRPQVLQDFKYILQNKSYDELFINLGKSYSQALIGYESLIPTNIKLTVSIGSLGRRQAELRNWLHSRLPEEVSHQTVKTPQGKVRIRGIEITLTPEQIFDEARRLLANDQSNSTNYQSWYVLIDHRRVAPKWLVSQLTGLPVGSFHTGEARRVLAQLGIEVHRN